MLTSRPGIVRRRRTSILEAILASHIDYTPDIPKPDREYRFHTVRKWRFDFAWPAPEFLIAVEVEGLTPRGGRHQTMSGYRGDIEKYNAAALLGWLVLRFTDREIRRGIAIRTIQEAFAIRRDGAARLTGALVYSELLPRR
jgi:hypothetical protein